MKGITDKQLREWEREKIQACDEEAYRDRKQLARELLKYRSRVKPSVSQTAVPDRTDDE